MTDLKEFLKEQYPWLGFALDHLPDTWWGTAILAMIAVALIIALAILGLAWIGGKRKDIAGGWGLLRRTRPDLLIDPLEISPLKEFSKVKVDPEKPVYPVGAEVSFNLRHDRRGSDVIIVDSIVVKLEHFEGSAACPFELTGDNMFGGAGKRVGVYEVQVAPDGSCDVHYREKPGEDHRGTSQDLLRVSNLKPVVTEDGVEVVEPLRIRISTKQPGRYRISIKLSYSSPGTARTRQVASLDICKPGVHRHKAA